MKAYQGELFQVVFLDQAAHKAHKARHVQREGDEAMIRYKWAQEILKSR